VRKNLHEFGISTPIVSMNVGYELRAADPIPFDIEYTRNLGYGAVRFLLKGGTGAMITLYESRIIPVPFIEMMDSNGAMKIRKVDIGSETYEVARKYMIRIEKEDFTGDRLRQIASATKLKPEAFRSRFGYLFPEIQSDVV
jgi:6-phosphofructokinase 1